MTVEIGDFTGNPSGKSDRIFIKHPTTVPCEHHSKWESELRVTDFWFAVFALRRADQRHRGDATPKIRSLQSKISALSASGIHRQLTSEQPTHYHLPDTHFAGHASIRHFDRLDCRLQNRL